jgi:hypothetical protein
LNSLAFNVSFCSGVHLWPNGISKAEGMEVMSYLGTEFEDSSSPFQTSGPFCYNLSIKQSSRGGLLLNLFAIHWVFTTCISQNDRKLAFSLSNSSYIIPFGQKHYSATSFPTPQLTYIIIAAGQSFGDNFSQRKRYKIIFGA